MTDKEFFQFVNEQYKTGSDTANVLYTRSALFLTAKVALGGAAYSLGRIDLFSRYAERVDIFLYLAFAGIAIALLSLAIWWLVRTLFPRDYPKVIKLSDWKARRDGYASALTKYDPASPLANSKLHEIEALRHMTNRVMEAAETTAAINQTRLLLLRDSIRFSAFAHRPKENREPVESSRSHRISSIHQNRNPHHKSKSMNHLISN